jgi:DNA-binding GntR family transcriptional regulator
MLLETDRVYQQLVKMIITLELEPGSTVTQVQLADLLSCGRTPLREATQRLMATGLLLHTANRGISVAPLDIRHYAPSAEAWACVHGFATRLAALRRTDEQLAQLDDVLARADQGFREARFSENALLDVEFHCLLAEASQNEYLADAAARLEFVVIRFSSVYHASRSVREEVWSYHEKILSSVRDRDPDKAERMLQAHMDVAKRHVFSSSGYMGAAD